jgi:GMP synthase-like glutamine amidotransferase
MKISVLKHVPFEGPAVIANWAPARGHELSVCEVFSGALPPVDEFDFLVVMGGPMNVYQDDKYPWLTHEKRLIAEAIDGGKSVLGICLGAQLIAVALGGKVMRNPHVEIGWFPIGLTKEGRTLPLWDGMPARFSALHWHGDTFTIPDGAIHLASSAACANQAFAYDEGRVVGLQFHLEETRESLRLLMENATSDLVEGDWIDTPEDLLSSNAPFDVSRGLMFHLLDRMATRAKA